MTWHAAALPFAPVVLCMQGLVVKVALSEKGSPRSDDTNEMSYAPECSCLKATEKLPGLLF